jgi:hypothetical protein
MPYCRQYRRDIGGFLQIRQPNFGGSAPENPFVARCVDVVSLSCTFPINQLSIAIYLLQHVMLLQRGSLISCQHVYMWAIPPQTSRITLGQFHIKSDLI